MGRNIEKITDFVCFLATKALTPKEVLKNTVVTLGEFIFHMIKLNNLFPWVKIWKREPERNPCSKTEIKHRAKYG